MRALLLCLCIVLVSSVVGDSSEEEEIRRRGYQYANIEFQGFNGRRRIPNSGLRQKYKQESLPRLQQSKNEVGVFKQRGATQAVPAHTHFSSDSPPRNTEEYVHSIHSSPRNPEVYGYRLHSTDSPSRNPEVYAHRLYSTDSPLRNPGVYAHRLYSSTDYPSRNTKNIVTNASPVRSAVIIKDIAPAQTITHQEGKKTGRKQGSTEGNASLHVTKSHRLNPVTWYIPQNVVNRGSNPFISFVPRGQVFPVQETNAYVNPLTGILQQRVLALRYTPEVDYVKSPIISVVPQPVYADHRGWW